jgi:orotidine-5'-phosphate decarboxylase
LGINWGCMETYSPDIRLSPVAAKKSAIDLLGSDPQPADRLIVALDQPSRNTALEMAASLQGVCRWLKVGLELYLATGQKMVEELTAQGFRVFVDLKLHDIPNTVAGAVRSVSGSGAELLTVHALGGPDSAWSAPAGGDRADQHGCCPAGGDWDF